MSIGSVIRNIRKSKGYSAEALGKRLQKPITRQAFLMHERKNSFTAKVVVEIAKILECSPTIFFESEEQPMNKKERFKNAVDIILPVAATLSSSEWSRIVSLINWHYSRKAAKTMLDGDDVQNMKEHLYSELGLNQLSE